MKIDVTQVLKDYKGEDMIIPGGKEKLTLRIVVMVSLNTPIQDKPMVAEDKNKAYQITSKLYASKEVELTVDDRAFIKVWAGEIQNPLVLGRISEIFEEKREKV